VTTRRLNQPARASVRLHHLNRGIDWDFPHAEREEYIVLVTHRVTFCLECDLFSAEDFAQTVRFFRPLLCGGAEVG